MRYQTLPRNLDHYEPVREDNESLESLVIQARRPDSLGDSPVWTNESRGRYDRSKLRYLSERPDRRGMGAVGAAHPAGEARRQQADGEPARRRQRVDVCLEHPGSGAAGPP